MNLLNRCTTKELKLLENIGINIDDQEYNKEELRKYEVQIEEYIMSHSTKNNDISRLSNKYGSILNKIIRCEQKDETK